jgi:hypothetical protein
VFRSDKIPWKRPAKKEGTVRKVVPILHSSAVDFGRHPASYVMRRTNPLGVNPVLLDAEVFRLRARVTVVVAPLECEPNSRTRPDA